MVVDYIITYPKLIFICRVKAHATITRFTARGKSKPFFYFICGKVIRKQFKFFSYNLSTKKIEKIYPFPSGDETGYGGMSFNPANKDELLISYYVINGERSYIKLIRADLKTFLQ